MLSSPRLSDRAIRSIMSPLGSQPASNAAKLARRRTMSGWTSNGSRASGGVFFQAAARTTPRRARALEGARGGPGRSQVGTPLGGAAAGPFGAPPPRLAPEAQLVDDSRPSRAPLAEQAPIPGQQDNHVRAPVARRLPHQRLQDVVIAALL